MPDTQECLVNFLTSLPWKSQATKREKLHAKQWAIHAMAPKLGVVPKTVRRWIAGTQKPIGLPLIKLRYLMDDYGHRASELDIITSEVRSLGAIIARLGADPQKAAEDIGFAQSSSLFRVLNGKRRLSPSRAASVANFISRFLDEA